VHSADLLKVQIQNYLGHPRWGVELWLCSPPPVIVAVTGCIAEEAALDILSFPPCPPIFAGGKPWGIFTFLSWILQFHFANLG